MTDYEKRYAVVLEVSIVMFLALLVFIVVHGILEEDKICQTVENTKLYWSCMDGCSNMLEVQYGRLNESLHPLQTECDNRCEEQYWRVAPEPYACVGDCD